ncbi:MAG TPA: type II CRISPR-associated endonuclease Cas1 [Ferrovibrio sp.]|uniref:type II CRISPR-associated endonuclease Cas1 n=1 Tax=Ferrovibrio sp. TaxID=1917215 RepID=UPI002ED097F9
MIGRIIEITQDGRHLSVLRGFMVVSADKEEVGRVPLDDIGSVIVNAHGVTYSNNLMIELAQRGTGMVLCGPNHAPAAWLWPLVGHHAQAARMLSQLGATRPMGKRLWQILVRAKIEQQGAVLRALGRPGDGFRLLARKVGSGDPENLEAQAARRYWPLLFGDDFRRDRREPGLNGLLNYGYTILRSATARAVVAAGLHPSLGIHHRHRANDMCLVDDLMEPFRPLVDLQVVRLFEAGITEVDRQAKEALAGLTAADMQTTKGVTPLGTCLERLASSLGQAFENNEAKLDLPLAPLPLDLAARGSDDDNAVD